MKIMNAPGSAVIQPGLRWAVSQTVAAVSVQAASTWLPQAK